MLYCQGYTVSFQEVPDEVSLVFLVGDCPYRCPGCHSPDMQKAEGNDLESSLINVFQQYADTVTCVCFMGAGQDEEALLRCANIVKLFSLKTALYTGAEDVPDEYLDTFDYIKTGPYIEKLGGLSTPGTNQHMYRIVHHGLRTVKEDITKSFQKEKT